MTDPRDDSRWVRDLPSTMARQWAQQAIPWCTVHNREAVIPEHDPPDECWQVVWTDELGTEGNCVVSSSGSDHKWWRDV